MVFDYDKHFLLVVSTAVLTRRPTTPKQQRPPTITLLWFSLFRVRSPLLTESLLFSLPVGTEMFHFPTFPSNVLCIQTWITWISPS